jgi:hypothetical protein
MEQQEETVNDPIERRESLPLVCDDDHGDCYIGENDSDDDDNDDNEDEGFPREHEGLSLNRKASNTKALAATETARVGWGRVVVLSSILVAAAVVSGGAYKTLERGEDADFSDGVSSYKKFW